MRRLDLTSFARRSIAPGAIKTNINNQVWSTREGERKLLTLIPYGRIGEPEDIEGRGLAGVGQLGLRWSHTRTAAVLPSVIGGPGAERPVPRWPGTGIQALPPPRMLTGGSCNSRSLCNPFLYYPTEHDPRFLEIRNREGGGGPPLRNDDAEEVDHEWRYRVSDLQQQRQEQSHRGLRHHQLAALAEAGFRVVAP